MTRPEPEADVEQDAAIRRRVLALLAAPPPVSMPTQFAEALRALRLVIEQAGSDARMMS